MGNISTIGERLRAERERLGFSQEAMAAIADVTRKTFGGYESDTRSPDALALAAWARAGLDLLFVVTGSRDYSPPPPLSRDELELVDLYRAAPLAVRAAAAAALASGKPPKGRGISVDFGQASIGQVIKTEGDFHQSGGVHVGGKKPKKG